MPKQGWIDLNQKYYMNVTKRQPITIVKGSGAWVWDDKGKEYLDFVAGWAVCSLGHSNPVILNALEKQAKELITASNQYYTVPQIQLAQRIADLSGMSKVYLANSGAEVNEGAIKLARKYGRDKLNGAFEIISTLNSFHGRTLATVAATGQERYQKPFLPMPEGFLNVPFNDVDEIKKATRKYTCAVLLEPVQGEGGVIVPDESYLKDVREWCDRKGLLLIFDEIQTGFGRLGTLFAFQQFGIVPDVITLAKGMGGGLPIGAFACKEDANVLEPGDHGTTFGGNPLCSAVSLAVINEIVKKDLAGNAKRVGKYLEAGMGRLQEKYPFVQEVRGRGLLLAMSFKSDVSWDVVTAANQEGLLLNPVRPNAIRIMPPLNLTRKEADDGIERLDRALAKVARGVGGK